MVTILRTVTIQFSWPLRDVHVGPQNFDYGLFSHGDRNKIAPLKNSHKKYQFFTVKKLIKAIAQNCTKMKGPMQNVIKSTEDHFSHINLDLGLEEGPTIWLPSLSTFGLFSILKKSNMAYLQ